MCRISRAAIAATFAGAIVVSAGLAQAGAGQCYDRSGRAIGPSYDTDHPNVGFQKWVTRIGGRCRRTGSTYFGSNKKPYPQAYLNPRGARRANRRQPVECAPGRLARRGPNIAPKQAERVVTNSFRRQGYGWARVRDAGLVIYVRGRLWRYLRVRTSGSSNKKVALRRTRHGRFVILENSGYGWDVRRVVRN